MITKEHQAKNCTGCYFFVSYHFLGTPTIVPPTSTLRDTYQKVHMDQITRGQIYICMVNYRKEQQPLKSEVHLPNNYTILMYFM